MTQRINNLHHQPLLEVCLKHLNDWPESWGKYVVAAKASGSNALWFGDDDPKRVPTGGWSSVGTVEVWLNCLPCNHFEAIVSRDYWLKHSRYTLLNMLVDSMPEWGEDCGEFAYWCDGAVVFVDGRPTLDNSGIVHSMMQRLGVYYIESSLTPIDYKTAAVTRSQWLAGSLKRQDKPTERQPESSAYQCEYYECPVDHPMNPRQGGVPYIANCEDIILALGMSFDEGCQFKAQWRRARGLQGFQKAESTPLRDAQKAVHYAKRVLAAEERKGA